MCSNVPVTQERSVRQGRVRAVEEETASVGEGSVPDKAFADRRLAVLIAEYELLREARAGSHVGSERRYANHLAVSAGLVALVALAANQENTPKALETVAWFAGVAAFVLGLATFARMVDFSRSRHNYDD